MIQESYKDITIKYLFVKKFRWHSPIDREEFQNEPLQGGVYRSIFNPVTQHHKILIPQMDGGGIGFDSLTASNELADFELIPLSLDNILDFEIKETDLDNLNKWFESENSDIKQMYSEREPENGLKKLKQALHHHDQGEAEALAQCTESLMDLWQVNPLKFSIMLNMIDYMVEADLDGYEDIAGWMRQHPTKGLPINISRALQALDRYAGDDRRSNEDMGDLYVAIEAIITEAERKISNGLID